MLNIFKYVPTDEDGFFVSFGKGEFAQYASDSDEVVFRALSDAYAVTLNGQPIEVREARCSAMPFNRPWPGKQRPFSQSESAPFISFSADEAVEVRVTPKRAFENALVRPLSRGVVPVREGEELVFTLTQAGSYVLELDGSHGVLHIFFGEGKAYAERESANYYFGAGVHFPGNIPLRDGDSVYVDPEAIVFGSVTARGAKNIRIYGGGVIDGSFEERISEHCYENHTKGNIRLYDCENVVIEDVILSNSASWCIALFGCDGVSIDGVKIVGQWRYNTDGIDLVNTKNVRIKNSFVRSFDDTITIKGIYDYEGVIENILVENCVLWCGWGHTCEIGIETAASAYRNITFRACDVIHTSGPALAVVGGNQAEISDIHFEDINVEFSADQEPEVLQMSDAQTYDPEGGRGDAVLIRINNLPYAIRTKNPCAVVRVAPKKEGVVRGVRFRNIRILTDDESIRPIVNIGCVGDAKNISDITIDSLSYNGERQTSLERFQSTFENCEGVKLI